MLKRTFIHLPGIGERTEAHFWRLGLLTWEDFLASDRIRGLGEERLTVLKEALEESLAQEDNPAYFATRLPAVQQWRLFNRFRPRAAYLDIETTGAAWPSLNVTVVGLYDGVRMRQFVQGYNLQEFPAALQDIDLVITFNGAQFDLPVLRAYFPGLRFPPVHVDLRFVLGRLGYKGGFKRIEPRFGIRRPPEVEGLDGYAAVLLWERYLRGDRTALETLLIYNREDVLNLEVLMEGAFRLHWERCFPG
ncbi:MAG: exonuclease [Deltaproteobacteria bacterium]|nr:exonuclease [Deltaproteobacteria bacterium]